MAARRTIVKPTKKKFLGFDLYYSPNLTGVWMNIEACPFICISHRGRVWTITVSFGGHKFEAEGPTEKKAIINFTNKLAELRETLDVIESRLKRR